MDSEFPDPAAGNIDPLSFSVPADRRRIQRPQQPFIKKPS